MIAVKFAICVLKLIYCPIKLFKSKKKATFISRQSNNVSQDAILLKSAINELYPDVEVILLFKKLDNKIFYCFHILRQMYHIATSRVVILDSYCIAISVLKHKRDLTVIQLWHALGSLKKFGFSVLNKDEGSDGKLAEAMKMHRNYDVIITSGEACVGNFAEAFNYPQEVLKVMSLPRVDLLTSKEYLKDRAKTIFETYPHLQDKKNIVYAPTFKKDADVIKSSSEYLKLVENLDFKQYNFIAKFHPLTEVEEKASGVIYDWEFSTMDMLAIADYVILDYSAVVYEAALMNLPVFFYVPDFEEYACKRDFYIDYKKEMPGIISSKAKDIINAIENDDYDIERVKNFADRYVENQSKCSILLANYVVSLIGEKQ